MTIKYSPKITRKNGLGLLGNGCENCAVRERCFMEKCNYVVSTKYKNMTDLANDYIHYSTAGFKVFIREYKKSYCLIVNGEKFKSGELDDKWRIHVYDKDRTKFAQIQFADDEVKDGYIRRKYLGFHYGLADKIPLKSDYVMIY